MGEEEVGELRGQTEGYQLRIGQELNGKEEMSEGPGRKERRNGGGGREGGRKEGKGAERKEEEKEEEMKGANE